MTSMKTFYQSLDESHKGVMRFGDGSSIRYETKVKYMWIVLTVNE